MPFDAERAAIRFGCGLSPRISMPESVDQMLERLAGPDSAAESFPVPGFDEILPSLREIRQAAKAIRNAKTEEEKLTANELRRDLRRGMRRHALGWFRQTLSRRVFTEDGLRERLVSFWADHFTAIGKTPRTLQGFAPYVEDAIRPHVAGRFADLLKAVIVHPVMLDYLDQSQSFGPNSAAAQKQAKGRGLNENLARELLELHLLGVNGPYTQRDVSQLAELLTGLHYTLDAGFSFRADLSEPGAETVLGQSFGGGDPDLTDILAALDQLSQLPATARHISQKLAVHFVSDRPDADLVDAMAARYSETKGDLLSVYEAMLRHPSSWHSGPGNVKPPLDFIASALRALDLVERHIPSKPATLRDVALGPMELMGQPWGKPLGPDGWPEEDAAWITPQRMAARIHWAMRAPFLVRRVLPDPRDFVTAALGSTAPEPLRFAASAAETRSEGIGLVLVSPQFQRM